jgi:eukaryotic translation initiation factor 2-alpha kinase 4
LFFIYLFDFYYPSLAAENFSVFEATKRVKTSLSNGMPTVAVDVPSTVFDAMTRNSSWVTEDEAWRQIANGVPTQHSPYAHQIREAVIKKKDEGHRFVLLFAVREEKVHLLNL